MSLVGSTAMVGVDVVVVTYKSSETVADAVGPLSGLDWVNVIAVDNASGDGTVDLLRTLPDRDDRARGERGLCARLQRRLAGRQLAVRPLPQPGRQDPARGAGDGSSSELDRDERIGAVAPRIEEPDGSLDYSLRRFPRLRSSFAQALFLHRVFPKATWVDEVIRDPGAYERRAPCRVGLRRLLRRAPERARGDRRSRRELLPLQRGRRHLRADLARGATRCGSCRRRSPSTRAARRRHARALLPILAASRIRYSAKHDSAPVAPRRARERGARGGDARRLRAERRRPGAATCARSASRSGRCPAEPSHLVRGTLRQLCPFGRRRPTGRRLP